MPVAKSEHNPQAHKRTNHLRENEAFPFLFPFPVVFILLAPILSEEGGILGVLVRIPPDVVHADLAAVPHPAVGDHADLEGARVVAVGSGEGQNILMQEFVFLDGLLVAVARSALGADDVLAGLVGRRLALAKNSL